MERGLLEIYRFVPPPLLETFDPETIDDVDEFLGWVAKARFMQELEEVQSFYSPPDLLRASAR